VREGVEGSKGGRDVAIVATGIDRGVGRALSDRMIELAAGGAGEIPLDFARFGRLAFAVIK
jgi:predicted nuclease with TOPRIM domain